MEAQEQTLQPTDDRNSESVTASSSSALNSRPVQSEITTYPRPITSGFNNP
ncbi:unnamed protein product, partial [Allacma fusca]